MKQHQILLLDHVSYTVFASDSLKTKFKEPCLLWQFVCPYICCNSFPTSRLSGMGGVCNDCVPIGWKLEVTLPLGRAGEVTERLKRTQSIWTLQTDRPKPKSHLYCRQARELPSTELVFTHQSALPPSPGGEMEPAGSPPAAGACHPIACNTTGAHGLAHPRVTSCQQPHVPLCHLHLQHDPHLNPCLLWLVSHWHPLLQGLWAVIPKENLWPTQPLWHRQGSLPGAGGRSASWATKLRSCLSPSGMLPDITVGGPAQMCPARLRMAHHYSHTTAD